MVVGAEINEIMISRYGKSYDIDEDSGIQIQMGER